MWSGGGKETRRVSEKGMRIGALYDGPWTDDMYDGETSDRPGGRHRIRWTRARPSTPSHTQISL